MADTLVFIPAHDEEDALPDVLEEARRDLPGADLLVIDDGSSDGTAEAARSAGVLLVSFEENRGLREGIAEGYRYADEHGYSYCGRLDADGQHLAAELAKMFEHVRAGECDVAIGSRFLPGSGDEDGERYRPAPERVVGTSLLRVLMMLRLRRRVSDATSGQYAVNADALRLLADPYVCEAPEVEALLRISDAGLRVLEVPVHMRQREQGESAFHGRRAAELVASIGVTLVAGGLLYRRSRGRPPSRQEAARRAVSSALHRIVRRG